MLEGAEKKGNWMVQYVQEFMTSGLDQLDLLRSP